MQQLFIFVGIRAMNPTHPQWMKKQSVFNQSVFRLLETPTPLLKPDWMTRVTIDQLSKINNLHFSLEIYLSKLSLSFPGSINQYEWVGACVLGNAAVVAEATLWIMCGVTGDGKRISKHIFVGLPFFFTVPLISVEGVLKQQGKLPCDVRVPTRDDRLHMVLWFRDNGEPIYR